MVDRRRWLNLGVGGFLSPLPLSLGGAGAGGGGFGGIGSDGSGGSVDRTSGRGGVRAQFNKRCKETIRARLRSITF